MLVMNKERGCKIMTVDKKREVLIKLKDSKEMFVLMSACTRAPHVTCDPETFDDEVYIFFKEEDAKAEVDILRKEGHPVQIVKIGDKGRLGFYMNLHSIGVNCIVTDKDTEHEMAVQLNELVKKREPKNAEEEKLQIENPQLHLTALYFMQKLRAAKNPEMTDEMKELYEEMMAHFQKGRFILAAKEDNQLPLLKQKDEKVFLPVFTDIQEFGRFAQARKEDKIKAIAVEASKLPGLVTKGISGIVLNPFGVNVPIQMKLKK